MEKKYPFKFLDSYTQNDTDIFFGRDEEIEALYEMVFQNSMLLVYGASGTGKTSLIQCGLASKFKSYDWLALTIRRGTNINDSLEKALIAAGGDDIDEDEARTNDSSKKLTGLLRLIKGVYLNSFKPIYLIFDQFEELYILGTKDEQEKFIEAVKEMQGTEQPLKMIFSIREEYLGHLFEFEKQIPQLLRKKLRVEPMTLNKVADVIKGINSSERSNVRIKTDEIDAITQGIFERLRGKKKTLTIQLPYLQVFLDKLYLETTKDETRKADALIELSVLNRIGDIGDVLRNFLEEQVAGISKKLSTDNRVVNPETIWRILSPFSTLEGTKEPISKKELSERLKDIDPRQIDEVVESFVNSRIVNYSESSNLYELAHDSLALRIAEKRTDEEISLLEVRRLIKNQVSLKQDARELFSKKQLNFIEPFLNKLNLTSEEVKLINESKEAEFQAEKKKRARRRTLTISVAAVTTLVIAGLSYFLIQQSIAKNKNIQLLSNSYWNNSKSKQAENDYVYALANAAMAFSISKDGNFRENILMEIENKWPVVNLKNILTSKSQIISAAYINDGKQIITLGKDHTITTWNALTGDSIDSKPSLPVSQKDRSLLTELTPDGKHVKVYSEAKVALWNIATSKMVEVDSIGQQDDVTAITSVEMSKDGKRLFEIATQRFTSYKIDVLEPNGKVILSRPLENNRWENDIPQASFSGNGKYIVAKHDDNRITIFNIDSGKEDTLNLMAPEYERGEYDGSEVDYIGAIKSLSFDNEGKTILTANSDSTIRLWDAKTGKQKGDHMRHNRPVEKAVFSPDGNSIMSIDDENSTFIWDTKTTTRIGHALKLEPGSMAPVFSPDGKNILSVINGTVSIWQLLERKDEDHEVSSNESSDYDYLKTRFFSPDLKKIVTKKRKRNVFIYRVLDAEYRKPIGQEIISKFDADFTDVPVWFSPDSKRLLIRYNEDSIHLWNADRATRIGDTIALAESGELVFSPIVKQLSGNNKKPATRKLITKEEDDTVIKLQLWNIEIGKKIGAPIIYQRQYQLDAQKKVDFRKSIDTVGQGYIDSAIFFDDPETLYQSRTPVFSADGNWVFTFFASNDSLYYEIYDAETGQRKGPRHSQVTDFASLGFQPVLSPDGSSILEMINDSTSHLLDAITGKQKGDVFQYSPIWSPAYSPDGKWLLICTSDSTAQFVDIATRTKGNAIKHLSTKHNDDVPSINKDGSRVLTIGNAGIIHLWDSETQRQIKEDFKHEAFLIPPVFSPDGKLFLTTDFYGSARLYDAETGNQKGPALKKPKSDIRNVLFTNDAKKILIFYTPEYEAYTNYGTVVLWNVETGTQIGQELKEMIVPSFFDESISEYLRFSEDGKWVLSSSNYDQQLLNTEAGDLDIPADLLALQVLMASGYTFDFSINEKNIITSKDFYGKDGLKENYYKKAVAHYKVCKFSKYNLWRRFNEEEAKKIRPDDFIEESKKDTTDSQFQILTGFNTSDTSKINNGLYLEPNQAISSDNKEWLLAYQDDGNLVIYRKNGMEPIWESNTTGYPAYRTVMQYDGNLVIYAADPGKILGNNAIWSSETPDNNDASLKLEDDGNLVIYDKKNKPIWQSKASVIYSK